MAKDQNSKYSVFSNLMQILLIHLFSYGRHCKNNIVEGLRDRESDQVIENKANKKIQGGGREKKGYPEELHNKIKSIFANIAS